jgi:Lrp/AsnC family transcriptional regulator for asnA, asnC and gidA
MTTQVEIDEIDVKILRELIKDARTKLKDIAKKCGLSSTAILNRIMRLKAEGVITGSIQFLNMSQMGYMYPASIGIDLKPAQAPEIARTFRERTNLVLLRESAGSSSFTIFLVAKSMKEIDDLKYLIRKQSGTNKIRVSLWSTPRFDFENIDLQPTRS